jgi:hypothetical protein
VASDPSISSLLICHEDELLNFSVLPRWLASFTELKGLVVLEEDSSRRWQRVRREIRRSGMFRFLDVLGFKLYYLLIKFKNDRRWERDITERLCSRFPPVEVPLFRTRNVNSEETLLFIREHRPDFMIARCKSLLKERTFTIPRKGTYVLHPGICPEYRNAHGCFWALANGDSDKVGLTLLKIDAGVDTGPVYGYFSYEYDAKRESHVTIQLRCLFENLDAVKSLLCRIMDGTAQPIDISGRKSSVWGQPWLSKYFVMRIRGDRKQPT